MNRVERVNSELKKQISIVLHDGLKDPRVSGMITVMNVNCDSDLTLAKVYVSILCPDGKEMENIAGLTAAEGYIKSEIKSKINLRAMPQLKFVYDDSIKYSMKISQIIEDLKK